MAGARLSSFPGSPLQRELFPQRAEMIRFALPCLLCLLCLSPLTAQSARPDRIETSIDKALKFLQTMQDEDGAWRLNQGKSAAATSLAVMAFLSAGHTPGAGPYGETVSKGIRWVLQTQRADGLIAELGLEMYQHGISTLMLAEVAGMTDAATAPKVKQALEKGVALILQAQRTEGTYRGGWRYSVNSMDADISVTGWQLLALRAAKNIGCDVPAERIDMAVGFIQRCRDAASGGYCYMPGANLTVPCTGTSILCLELCHKHHAPESLRAGSYLLRHPPTWNSMHFFYNVYYGSQAIFQLGGNYWNLYRPQLHKVLLDNQQANGSWMNHEGYGPVYATSMSVLALTVEYRYLPIYQRGEEPEPQDSRQEQP